MASYRLAVNNAVHGNYAGRFYLPGQYLLVVKSAVQAQFPELFWIVGEHHNNTEHVTYDATDYLKCSHNWGVLTGVYTSDIFDLLASGRYMVYIDAPVVVTGVGTTWDDIIPSPDTWNNIDISNKTWSQIFELSAGPKVQISLLYGETSPPANEVKRLEILSTIVTGRYFQVKITIIDPSEAINALVKNFTMQLCQ